jgi:predicted ATP-binding protein involved in virulence
MSELLEGFGDLRVEEDPLRLIVNKAGYPLDIAQLSDGERSFLAVVTDLCRRLTLANPGLDDPLQGEGVVLIDELELHLHPKWQRTVIEKLRSLFPRLQFIGTTHSPFVIQTLRKDELRLLDREILSEYSGRGIEEVTRFIMDVQSPEVSPRYQQMLEIARDYFALLEQPIPMDAARKDELRRRLQEMTAPYADNPAYQALLEQKRMAKGL